MSDKKISRKEFLTYSAALGVSGIIGTSLLSSCGRKKYVPLKEPGEYYVPELPDKAVAGKTESIDTQEERDALYESYVNYCENGYDGIDFDFEGIDAGMQEVYSEFLKKTASRLHQMGKKVSHCVGFYPNMYEDENALMFYDPEVLNEVCDLVRIMCYDMYWAPGNAGGDAPSYFGPTSHYAWAKLAVEHWMKKISATGCTSYLKCNEYNLYKFFVTKFALL